MSVFNSPNTSSLPERSRLASGIMCNSLGHTLSNGHASNYDRGRRFRADLPHGFGASSLNS
jgi:hypothetical protein